MNLFQIIDSRTGQALPGEIQNKTQARALRKTLNDAAGKPWFFIRPGPDHHKYCPTVHDLADSEGLPIFDNEIQTP
jgi:hypothetical protein